MSYIHEISRTLWHDQKTWRDFCTYQGEAPEIISFERRIVALLSHYRCHELYEELVTLYSSWQPLFPEIISFERTVQNANVVHKLYLWDVTNYTKSPTLSRTEALKIVYFERTARNRMWLSSVRCSYKCDIYSYIDYMMSTHSDVAIKL